MLKEKGGEDDGQGYRMRKEAYERNNLCGLRGEFVGELFVVSDQVSDVDVAVVFLDESVLAQLISIPQLDIMGKQPLARFD